LQADTPMGSLTVAPRVPVVCVTAHVCDKQLAEFELVPDPSRPRKAVRGARSAGGERTWLRKQQTQPAASPLPGSATALVSCGGRTFEFQLEHGAHAPPHHAFLAGSLTLACPVASGQLRRVRVPACCGSQPFLERSLRSAGAFACAPPCQDGSRLNLCQRSLLHDGFALQLRFRVAAAGALRALKAHFTLKRSSWPFAARR